MKRRLIGTCAFALAVAGQSCAGRGGSPERGPESITPVRVSGRGGIVGKTDLHNDPRFESRTMMAPLRSVWEALPGTYRALGIDGVVLDAAQWDFGALDVTPRRIAGRRLSNFLDCGMGLTAVPKADEYAVTMSVRTRLSEAQAEGTVLTTVVTAQARHRAQSGNPVYCQSTGALEELVYEQVRAKLGT